MSSRRPFPIPRRSFTLPAVLLLLLLRVLVFAPPASAAPPWPAFPDLPAETPLLDPGLDPLREQQRLDRGVGWGGRGVALGLLLLLAWGTTAARRAGRERRTRLLLLLATLSLVWLLAELVLALGPGRWARHVKIRSGCYHDNPRGYFLRSAMRGRPEVWAWCTDRLEVAWTQCDLSTREAARERFRILAVGDSFTDGVGVFRRDAWPAALQRGLARRRPSLNPLVVNCGKADAGTLQVSERLFARVDRHDPQVVVYALVLNDIPPPPGARAPSEIGFQIEDPEVYDRRIGGEGLGGWMVRNSALVRLVREATAEAAVARETTAMYRRTWADPDRPVLRAAMEAVGRMRAACRDRGARFLVAIWPLMEALDAYPFSEAHARIREELDRRGVPYLDLLPAFAGKEQSALWAHPTDHHPNEVAHGIAAEAIAAELERRGWLPAGGGP